MSRGNRQEVTMNNKDEYGSYELPELSIDGMKKQTCPPPFITSIDEVTAEYDPLTSFRKKRQPEENKYCLPSSKRRRIAPPPKLP